MQKMWEIKKAALLVFFAIVLVTAAYHVSSVSSAEARQEDVFLGTEVTDNRVSVSNRDVGMLFDYLVDHAEGGWYYFDGEMTAKIGIGTWDFIVEAPVDMNVQIGFWVNETREVSTTVCTNHSYMENDTFVLNQSCQSVSESVTGFGWSYQPADAQQRTGSSYRTVFSNIAVEQNETLKVSFGVERVSVPGHQLIDFDIIAVPAGKTIEEAKALGLGGGVDPVVNSSINEITRWNLTGDGQDAEGRNHLYVDGVTFVTSTIGTSNVTVGNWDGTNDRMFNDSHQYMDCPNGCSFSYWVKVSAQGERPHFSQADSDGGDQGANIPGYTISYFNACGSTCDGVGFWTPTSADVAMGSVVTINQWHHVAIVVNETTGKEIWLDGVLNASTANTDARESKTKVFLGRGAQFYFQGQMAAFRYFNASLTPTQIALLYNSGEPSYEALATLEGGGSSNANESEGDNAIKEGIDSAVPLATKYKERHIYVRNESNNQTLGTFDWMASFGGQRWLINYITENETYVRSPNISTTLYTLEVTGKTVAEITSEVSLFINATRT